MLLLPKRLRNKVCAIQCVPKRKPLVYNAQAGSPFKLLIGLFVGTGVIAVGVRIPGFSKRSDWARMYAPCFDDWVENGEELRASSGPPLCFVCSGL